MINVSAEFLALMEQRTDFRCNADITFADGSILNLDKSAFTLANNAIIDAACSVSFPLGVAMSRSIQIELLNDQEQYKSYDFFGAKIRLYLTFELSNSVEKVEMGTFTVLEPETYGETVIVIAQDDMYKADKAYTTSLLYPASLSAVFRELCENCSLPYSSGIFTNSSFMVQSAPSSDLTCRQVLGYIAMIAGGNARINREGDVEIITYDFETSKTNLKNWIYLHFDTSDIVITGLKLTTDIYNVDDASVTHTFGDEGYMLAIANPLLAGQEDDALALIGSIIVGHPFRRFGGDLIANPLLEFMDTVSFTDRKGNVYTTVLTDINFLFFGATTLSVSAEPALRNTQMYITPETQAIIAAKKLVEAERNARELAMGQLAEKLATASGMYSTDEEQLDGSVIRYLHDKPTLEASGNVIKITAEAIGFSTDGGKSYPYGLEISGDVITKILSAEGVNANWINVGALTAKNTEGETVFKVDVTTGEVTINGTTGGVSFENCPFKTSHSKTYYTADYTDADLERVRQIQLNTITPTQEDYDKFDFLGDGEITVTDVVFVRNMLLGRYGEWAKVTWFVEITPSNKQHVITAYHIVEYATGEMKTVTTLNLGADGITDLRFPASSSGVLATSSEGKIYVASTINAGLLPTDYSATTDDEIDYYIRDIFAYMADGEMRYIRITPNTSDSGASVGTWFVQLVRQSESYGYIVASRQTENLGTDEKRKTLWDGVWSDWMWVTPAMMLDVEYLTTKRYNGKPVYAKRFSYVFENGMSGSRKYNVPHGVLNLETIVSKNGWASTGDMLPYTASDGTTSITAWDADNIIVANTGSGWGANRIWYFDLEYTKTI